MKSSSNSSGSGCTESIKLTTNFLENIFLTNWTSVCQAAAIGMMVYDRMHTAPCAQPYNNVHEQWTITAFSFFFFCCCHFVSKNTHIAAAWSGNRRPRWNINEECVLRLAIVSPVRGHWLMMVARDACLLVAWDATIDAAVAASAAFHSCLPWPWFKCRHRVERRGWF